MNRQALTLLVVSFSLTTSGAWSRWNQAAQSSQQSSPSQNNGQPASSQTTTSPAPPATTSSPVPDKKVWTNEDMGGLRDRSPISTIGSSTAKPGKPSDKPSGSARGKDAKWYHDQIDRLQAKIPPLDDKIRQLQAALSGEPVHETRQYGGARIDDWRDQLERLQKQRDDLEAKIGALRDEARHDGVPSNALP